jgi:hypothetical protein
LLGFRVDAAGQSHVVARFARGAIGCFGYSARFGPTGAGGLGPHLELAYKCFENYITSALGAGDALYLTGIFSGTDMLLSGFAPLAPLVSSSQQDSFLAKISSTGLEWIIQHPGKEFDAILSFDAAGHAYVTSTNGLKKIRRDGSLVWVRNIPAPFAVDSQGQIYRAGEFTGMTNIGGFALTSAGGRDLFLAKIAAEPVFTNAPVNLTVAEHDTLSLSAGVIGTAPFQFQWRLNDADLPGQTNAHLTLSDVQTHQAGNFSVVVANLAGAATGLVATVTVTPVNDPPIAADQQVMVSEDNAVAITLMASDPEGDPLTYSVGTPMHGSLAGTAPNLTYQPAPDYFGPDAFTFQASDGALTSAVATVSITVLPVNDPPVADASATVAQVVAHNGISAPVLLDGRRSVDPENDPLAFAWFVDGSPHPLLPSPGDAPGTATAVLTVGTHSVKLIVSDGSLTGTNAISVAVVSSVTTVEGLKALVQASGLPAKVERELLRKLNQAAKEFDHNHLPEAVRALRDFETAVRKNAAKGLIPSSLAEALIAAAEQIIAATGLCDEVETLRTHVLDLQLDAKFERQLLGRLEAACRALDRGDTKKAVQELKQFQKVVSKAAGRRISAADAQALIAEVQAILANL